MGEKQIAYDSYKDYLPHDGSIHQLRRIRANQARVHIARLVGDLHPQGTTLEIGPGMGGVTLAHKELYPNRATIAIDIDDDPLIAKSAEQHNVKLVQVDVLQLTPAQLTMYLEKVDIILALRTSAAVAKKLLEMLPETPFVGKLGFTLMVDPDLSHFLPIAQRTEALGGIVEVITQGRIPIEVGYVLNFPLVGSEEVT